MGTSVTMIDRTYGYLARDSETHMRERVPPGSGRFRPLPGFPVNEAVYAGFLVSHPETPGSARTPVSHLRYPESAPLPGLDGALLTQKRDTLRFPTSERELIS